MNPSVAGIVGGAASAIPIMKPTDVGPGNTDLLPEQFKRVAYTRGIGEETSTAVGKTDNTAFLPNGSSSKAFKGSAFNQRRHQHHKKDIGERGYDTDVQQFVWDAIPPMNTKER